MRSTLSNLPTFLCDKLTQQYSALAEQIADGLCEHVTCLRVNRLKSDPETVKSCLQQAGFKTEALPFYEDALLVRNGDLSTLRHLSAYSEGLFYLQNPSAMLPALWLQPMPGEDLLDMAAAPGGKTTQLAALCGNKAQITACERHPIRAERLRFNLERQGAGSVTVLVRDARQLEDWFSFDRILLDAPCTGSGTLNAQDEADSAHITPILLKKCTTTQKALLQKADRLLKKGGRLVYSTCSVLYEENEATVMPLLKSGRYRACPIDPDRLNGISLLPCQIPEAVCVCPTDCFEGFFAVALEKC